MRFVVSVAVDERGERSGNKGVECDTYLLTEQTLAAAAVEAVVAQLRDVGRDAITNLEVGHLGADGGHHADGLMARDERKLGDELALMDVLGDNVRKLMQSSRGCLVA